MIDKKRYNDIKRMRKNRYTYKAIGEKYNITKGRVWTILNGKKK